MKKSWFTVFAVLALYNLAAFAAETNPATALRAKYTSLQGQLDRNAFQLPLHLDSRKNSGDLQGDIYALVDYSFVTVGSSVQAADQWCSILLLHLNVKYCRAGPGKQITVYIGRKYYQPLDAAHHVEFSHHVAKASADYLQVSLHADKGPLGTRNYRIMLEAVPLEDKTFIHLSYSYGYGLMARLASEAYFSTAGSNKYGFTVTGKKPDGQPIYIDDMRGALERNTMRYYLALDAYLQSLSAPQPEQFEKRLRRWFELTKRYPQLHEVSEDEYLDMKRKELERQQVMPPQS